MGLIITRTRLGFIMISSACRQVYAGPAIYLYFYYKIIPIFYAVGDWVPLYFDCCGYFLFVLNQ